MPFTFFAHQAIVLPLKIKRPRWFDATALCIGSMAPDFAYPFRGWIARHGHTGIGILAWGLPFTLVVSFAVRRWVAATAFGQLPDFGPLQIHSLRVLGLRRPPHWATISSALIGVGSHVLLDGFTHKKSFGSRWLGLQRTLFQAPWHSGVSIARTLQYFMHSFGSMAGVLLLWYIARIGLMAKLYGRRHIAEARSFALSVKQRIVFWSVVALGFPLAPLWVAWVRGSMAMRLIASITLTTAIASAIPFCRPREIPLPRPTPR